MIHFDKSRMQEVLENHTLWWEGKLDRPLSYVRVVDAYPRVENKYTHLTQANCDDFSVDPEEYVRAVAASYESYEFLGDSFPHFDLVQFGPGVLAPMLGSKLDTSSGRVWFFPNGNPEISELHVKYDPNNMWSKRIKDIAKTALEYFDGSVLVGFPDFGGILDIAASLIGTEELLFATIEEPEEVKRLCDEIQVAWYDALADFTELLKSQGCFTDWNHLVSKTPTHVIQCDFSTMISRDMFKEFVLEYLRLDTKKLEHEIYHLDGPGALMHLDDLLSLEKLSAIQWVYGAGAPTAVHWTDVYKKIREAGKQYQIKQVIEDPFEVYEVMKKVGGTPYLQLNLRKSDSDIMNKILSYR